MSEEEKKAIKYLKRHIIPVYGKNGNIEYMLNDVLLNLIEKLQKEIEIWKETENDYEHELARKDEKIEELENADLTTVYMSGFYEGEKKWKDKIKDKVKILEKLLNETKNEKAKETLEIKIIIYKELLKE